MARTRARDFEDKKRAILHSAACVFARMGMEKASMAHIAAHCKISKSLLYHYYPAKDVLIFEIVHTHLSDMDAALETTLAECAQEPPPIQLRKMVQQILECYKNADDPHKVQLNCSPSLNAEQIAFIHALERRIVTKVCTVLENINPDINRQRPLCMPIAMSLFGILNWVYLWFRPDGALSREEYGDVVARMVLEGILQLQ